MVLIGGNQCAVGCITIKIMVSLYNYFFLSPHSKYTLVSLFKRLRFRCREGNMSEPDASASGSHKSSWTLMTTSTKPESVFEKVET